MPLTGIPGPLLSILLHSQWIGTPQHPMHTFQCHLHGSENSGVLLVSDGKEGQGRRSSHKDSPALRSTRTERLLYCVPEHTRGLLLTSSVGSL